MITVNFEDYPDIRINFFKLIESINKHCFEAFLHIPAEHFKLVIDSVVWAFKHHERNISETGLAVCKELLGKIEGTHIAQQFYEAYFLQLLQDVFVVLTDTLHKTGFKSQSEILQVNTRRLAHTHAESRLLGCTETDPAMDLWGGPRVQFGTPAAIPTRQDSGVPYLRPGSRIECVRSLIARRRRSTSSRSSSRAGWRSRSSTRRRRLTRTTQSFCSTTSRPC